MAFYGNYAQCSQWIKGDFIVKVAQNSYIMQLYVWG